MDAAEMIQHQDHRTRMITRTERTVQLLMRAVGSVALLAIPCALMPYSWMNAVHQWLGMGQLPSEPVVGYLARSTSAFYALIGGLLWVVSFDVRRHWPVVRYLGVAIILIGLMLLAVDLIGGMPWWWCLVEGPFDIGFGTVILMLGWRIGEKG